MKKYYLNFAMIMLAFSTIFTSCSKDDNKNESPDLDKVAGTYQTVLYSFDFEDSNLKDFKYDTEAQLKNADDWGVIFLEDDNSFSTKNVNMDFGSWVETDNGIGLIEYHQTEPSEFMTIDGNKLVYEFSEIYTREGLKLGKGKYIFLAYKGDY